MQVWLPYNNFTPLTGRGRPVRESFQEGIMSFIEKLPIINRFTGPSQEELAKEAGMTLSEWKAATKLGGIEIVWIIMDIGMAAPALFFFPFRSVYPACGFIFLPHSSAIPLCINTRNSS